MVDLGTSHKPLDFVLYPSPVLGSYKDATYLYSLREKTHKLTGKALHNPKDSGFGTWRVHC